MRPTRRKVSKPSEPATLETFSCFSPVLMTRNHPENVGILAIHAYFPNTYVTQSDLEAADSVLVGKYTIGLGQKGMAVALDNEDAVSMCMTAVTELMERHEISPESIGRLEVGTESNPDKSKSIKSHLMQLFPSEATDIGGVDNVNACYGGTAALLNSLDWLEGPNWDGRVALVVAADIAVYGVGPARPTGGAGAVAILLGPNAPIIMERSTITHFMHHSWDFYKPSPASEYPMVDGRSSVECYLRALDSCYDKHLQKKEKLGAVGEAMGLEDFDYFVFHSPYGKLVQKSLGRLLFNDVLRNYRGTDSLSLDQYRGKLVDTYFDKSLDALLIDKSRTLYEEKTLPTRSITDEIGNAYCASLFMGLCSLLAKLQGLSDSEALGKRIGMFSYGSGLAATMFTLLVVGDLQGLSQSESEIQGLLSSRRQLAALELVTILKEREALYGAANWSPKASTKSLRPGTFYLDRVDGLYRRYYNRLP